MTGIFEEGNVYTNEVGDFAPMRTWVIGKLMWNPALDQDRLIDEFLRSYYGAAAPYLRRYIDLYQQSYLAQDMVLSTFNTNLSFITLDVANESVRLFEQAENAVKDDKVLLERVRQERLSLEIALLLRYNTLKQIAVRENKEFLAPQNLQQALVDFTNRCKALGVKNWRLGSNLNDDMRTIREALTLTGHFSDD